MNFSLPHFHTGAEIVLDSENDTRQFAAALGEQLKGGETIGLSGSLGAGKTTFTRFLVQSLGSQTPVSSPTYVLQHEYTTGKGLVIEHWDLYRLAEMPEELHGECGSDRIRLIEWPERAPELLTELDLHLNLGFPPNPVTPDQRRVVIEKGLLSGV